jgi:hypothetical protein
MLDTMLILEWICHMWLSSILYTFASFSCKLPYVTTLVYVESTAYIVLFNNLHVWYIANFRPDSCIINLADIFYLLFSQICWCSFWRCMLEGAQWSSWHCRVLLCAINRNRAAILCLQGDFLVSLYNAVMRHHIIFHSKCW